MQRSGNCLAKLGRMNGALRHVEPDRVPVSDFFWGGFVSRWRQELGLPADADPYRYYDLDWIVANPNMDPHIKQFEVLRETDEEVVVRTGFEAVIRKRFDLPMPAYLEFETDTIERMAAFRFDAPDDERRFAAGGDNQIGGVGDAFVRNQPPWLETVRSLYTDFPVYGSVAEAHEMLWRIIGSDKALLWMGLYPEEVGRFVERLHEFVVGLAQAQIAAADGLLAGMVVWGDVAYRRAMLFSPDYWRRWFKPGVRAIVDVCHAHGLPVIYHGCGNLSPIIDDLIEVGIDALNPLEAKAGLDVVDLRRRHGHRIAFCGNMDVGLWAEGSHDELEHEVRRKLNAGKGGGFIFQSDHSVPSNVSGEAYDYVVGLVRRHGRYPLQLGDADLPDLR
ncbi:MAG: uroporphyrinogen decarboxylase family protein [Anaerolineae bacterium]